MAEARRVRYTDLVGRPVLDADGQRVGTLFDVVVERDGDEAVVRRLLVGGGSHRSPLDVIRRLRDLDAIPADALTAIDEDGLHVRGRLDDAPEGRSRG